MYLVTPKKFHTLSLPIEPIPSRWEEARERLAQTKARHFLELSLQDAKDLPDQHLWQMERTHVTFIFLLNQLRKSSRNLSSCGFKTEVWPDLGPMGAFVSDRQRFAAGAPESSPCLAAKWLVDRQGKLPSEYICRAPWFVKRTSMAYLAFVFFVEQAYECHRHSTGTDDIDSFGVVGASHDSDIQNDLRWVDQRDSSLCRSEAALCQVFAQAGLKILDKKPQEEWPEKLLPVFWNAKVEVEVWGVPVTPGNLLSFQVDYIFVWTLLIFWKLFLWLCRRCSLWSSQGDDVCFAMTGSQIHAEREVVWSHFPTDWVELYLVSRNQWYNRCSEYLPQFDELATISARFLRLLWFHGWMVSTGSRDERNDFECNLHTEGVDVRDYCHFIFRMAETFADV